MSYEKGQRVKPSLVALNQGVFKNSDRRGTVKNKPRGENVPVVWDGHRYEEYVAPCYLEATDV